MKKTVLMSALGLAMGVVSLSAVAATVANGDVLHITPGVATVTANGVVTAFTGSYFGMDTNGDSKISQSEKTALAEGTTGLVIGTTTVAGASHSGAPLATDTSAIDKPWFFFSNTGSDFLKSVVTGSTTAGLDMSGWNVSWNAIPAINMGGGAWQPLNCSVLGCTGHVFTNGNAMFTWNGANNGAYSLNYAATVPLGDPSGFGGVHYYLHLEGAVSTVPVPAAAWLFGSGLVGLVGVARRKKA